MKNRAVVLVSGGMDSLVSAAIAIRQYSCYFLHISYGQRTMERERKAFSDIADYYKIDNKLIIEMAYFKIIGGSALTDDKIDVPKELNLYDVPVTYVPFRNANFLSAAVSWAETVKAEEVFIGATEEDFAGYPDCRSEFYQQFNKVIKEGTKAKNIEVITPVINMNKAEIVKIGREINAPFNLSWSCYERVDIPCGKCDSCLRRIKAFKDAGYDDPIQYAS